MTMYSCKKETIEKSVEPRLKLRPEKTEASDLNMSHSLSDVIKPLFNSSLANFDLNTLQQLPPSPDLQGLKCPVVNSKSYLDNSPVREAVAF